MLEIKFNTFLLLYWERREGESENALNGAVRYTNCSKYPKCFSCPMFFRLLKQYWLNKTNVNFSIGHN